MRISSIYISIIAEHCQVYWTAHISIWVLKSNLKDIFLELPEQTNWLPAFIAGGMAGLAVLCIIASVVAYVKAQNKTEKKPKTDSPDQGTI